MICKRVQEVDRLAVLFACCSLPFDGGQTNMTKCLKENDPRGVLDTGHILDGVFKEKCRLWRPGKSSDEMVLETA